VRRLLGLALACVVASACATPEQGPPYRHSRYDYQSFRGRVGSLPEPNYLPFLAHAERLPDGSRALVFCRWPDASFPLRYHVEPPVIPEAVQDEFTPKRPGDYVEAVRQAFTHWQREIGRPVRFEPVQEASAADLRVRLEPGLQASGEGFYGGRAQGGPELCSVPGPGADPDHVEVRFRVDTITLFIVDPVGLLTPGQVKLLAMHEIGHALGASGQHSPLRGDLMFRIADDSRIQELSEHDANSFRALYRLAPGSVYARLDEQHPTPMVEARRGPPRLGPEIDDPRFGVRLRFPRHWQVIRTPRGWIAVDGVSWDYDASVQVIGVRGTPEALFDRYGAAYLAQGEFVTSDVLEVDDRRIPRIVIRRGYTTEVTSIVEWGEGRLLLVVADSRSENFDLYRPWFQSVLLSLEPSESPARPANVGAGPEAPDR
jgi:hypothetical protein